MKAHSAPSETQALLPVAKSRKGRNDPPYRIYACSVLLRFLVFSLLTITLMSAIVFFLPDPLSEVEIGVAEPSSRHNIMLGKKHKSSNKNSCKGSSYAENTLKLAYELPLVALFKDTKGQHKFDATDITTVSDNIYVTYEKSWAISKFKDRMERLSTENMQIGNPKREAKHAEFRAILYDSGVFFVLQQRMMQYGNQTAPSLAIVDELTVNSDGTDYVITAQCESDHQFDSRSLGFSGAIKVHDLDNNLVILAICQDNFCSETSGHTSGNGRLVAMRKVVSQGGACKWETARQVIVPPSADFRKYDGIALNADGQAAILSTKDSQVWVGKLTGMEQSSRLWNMEAIAFDFMEGRIYDFPKNDNCKTQYCNIVGIEWIDNDRLVAVSSRMKEDQDFECFKKAESSHLFLVP